MIVAMPDICLQKINVLPVDVPADVNLQLRRVVNALRELQRVDVLWRQLDSCRVLKFRREFYALDNFLLISVLASQFPKQQISVLEIPVKTEKELKQRVVESLIINSLCAITPTHIPNFERSCTKSHQTEKLFNSVKWAEILGVHRTTLYPKSPNTQSHQIATVDLSKPLKNIPFPRNGSASS